MLFLTNEKTNWRFIFLIIALALIVGGTVLDLVKNFKQSVETSPVLVEAPSKETQKSKIVKEIKQESQTEKELEIYPYDADVSICVSSRGKKFPTTGLNSAKWFVWGGCAKSKFYNVVPGKELIFHVYTDSCLGCVCHHPNFYIFESQNGKWEQTKYFDLPDIPKFSENIFYTPSSDKIKISANDCFYLRVFSGNIEEVEKELGKKIKTRQKLAEEFLEEFMKARMAGDEEKALSFLTENSREQFLREVPLRLTNLDISEYRISQVREITETNFEFIVETISKDQPGKTIELIEVSEVLGEFFVNSIKLPG